MVRLSYPTGLWARLRAWWHGRGVAFAALVDLDALVGTPDAPACDVYPWTPERIAAVQMVCGDGASIPGGGRFAKTSLKYLGLDNTMSVVDYGAQLGLFARVAAKTAGAWVDACEPDPVLAAAAQQLTRGRRLSRRTSVHAGELLQMPIRDHSQDAVIAVEAMHRTTTRPAHLTNIARMLKPGGKLLVIDYFREVRGPSSPAIADWRRYEAVPARLPRLEHLQVALRRLHLRLTLTQDITEEYCRNLTRGLKRLATQLPKHPPETATHQALLREVEFWGARLRVLKSGDVSVLRLLVTRPVRAGG